jgi:hypothetical protein
MCACAWEDKWGRRETLYEFIEEHYMPLTLSSKDARHFNPDMTAYETGSGGQHVHSWGLCGRSGCGCAAAHSYQWTIDPLDEVRQSWLPGNRDDEYYRFMRDCVYCSFECFAIATKLSRCPSCNEFTVRQFNVAWQEKSFAVLFESIIKLNAEKDYRLVKMCSHAVCSSQCARRHIEKIKETSRHLELFDEESKCLHEVKTLVRKAKKAMRSNDHEVLSMLRKEFEQVGTSPE